MSQVASIVVEDWKQFRQTVSSSIRRVMVRLAEEGTYVSRSF